MNWTEQKPPTEGESFYDHITCKTPLGEVLIEWKSWKKDSDYSIMLNDVYLGTEYGLNEAKYHAEKYLMEKLKELVEFLAKKQ